jgi:LPS O-antigen subunit length determinant protein (WzzB/FepE family)
MVEIATENIRQRLGNVEQIRDLLFGEKIKAYEQNFERMESDVQLCKKRLDVLENDLQEWQKETENRLQQLQNSLSEEIRTTAENLEKKLKFSQMSLEDKNRKLEQEIAFSSKLHTDNNNNVAKNLQVETKQLKDRLETVKDQLENQDKLLKEQIFVELDKKIAELQEGKMSRKDLAEMLFDLCFRIKDNKDNVPVLQEGENNHQMQAELILSDRELG